MLRAAKIANLSSETDRRIFLNEVHVLKQLDSPYNVRMIEYYVPETITDIVNEDEPPPIGIIVYHYIQGKDLLDTINDQIHRKTRFRESEVVSIARQILKAVSYVNNCGIVHRDIKPENFMVETEPNGRFNIKLIDFGLSKPSAASYSSRDRIGGTWFYSAPETARNQYSQKSDAWSVGVILSTLVSYGTALIGRSTSMGNNGAHQVADPQFIQTELSRLQRKGVSQEQVLLISRLLETTPHKRASSHEALLDPYLNNRNIEESSVRGEIRSWIQCYERFERSTPIQKQVRLFWAHQINDSLVPHLRYLFRILDRDAKGFIAMEDLVRESPDESFRQTGPYDPVSHLNVGFEKFIAIGLDDSFLDDDHLSIAFGMISASEEMPLKDMVRSLFGHEAPITSFESLCGEGFKDGGEAISIKDFIRCTRSAGKSAI